MMRATLIELTEQFRGWSASIEVCLHAYHLRPRPPKPEMPLLEQLLRFDRTSIFDEDVWKMLQQNPLQPEPMPTAVYEVSEPEEQPEEDPVPCEELPEAEPQPEPMPTAVYEVSEPEEQPAEDPVPCEELPETEIQPEPMPTAVYEVSEPEEQPENVPVPCEELPEAENQPEPMPTAVYEVSEPEENMVPIEDATPEKLNEADEEADGTVPLTPTPENDSETENIWAAVFTQAFSRREAHLTEYYEAVHQTAAAQYGPDDPSISEV